MLENTTRKQDLKIFEDWFGDGDVGYKTTAEAEKKKAYVDAELKNSIGEVSYVSTVKERLYYTGFWVYVKRIIDYNHPDRIEKRL